MKIETQLKKIRDIRNVEPDGQWSQQTLTRLLNQYDSHTSVRVRNLPFGFPAFAVAFVAFGILTAVALKTEENQSNNQTPLATLSAQSPTAAVKTLPLAMSVANPSAQNPIAVSQRSGVLGITKKIPAKRRNRPLARTRLAISVQSIPDAKWVFSEHFPAEQSRWVFSNQAQGNGS